MPTDRVFIALGSNLGDSPAIVGAAMDRLDSISCAPVRRSSLWTSTPVDCPPGSPRFINAVVEFFPQAGQSPESLLAQLQSFEVEAGRRPKLVLNEARPLDLDLIAWGAEIRNTPFLVLPHPRAHLRRFVLQPLAELAPDFLLPGQTNHVGDLLAHLSTEEILRRFAPAS